MKTELVLDIRHPLLVCRFPYAYRAGKLTFQIVDFTFEEGSNKIGTDCIFQWFEELGCVGHGAAKKGPLALKTLGESRESCVWLRSCNFGRFLTEIQLSIFCLMYCSLKSALPTAAPRCRVPSQLISIPVSFELDGHP